MAKIEIPDEMYEAIRNIIKEDPALGYESPDEFAREAIRNLLITF